MSGKVKITKNENEQIKTMNALTLFKLNLDML